MNNFTVDPSVFENIAKQQREKCDTCGCSRYEHIDHSHAALVERDGRCPFGDCSNFQAVGASDQAEQPRPDAWPTRGAHSDGNAHDKFTDLEGQGSKIALFERATTYVVSRWPARNRDERKRLVDAFVAGYREANK